MSTPDLPWLASIGRQTLAIEPTPLQRMERLSAEIGGPEIWIKRDDCTGLATGGNKTRKLEYLLADALTRGADTIITYGAVQSNHARQTAAACAQLGLNCHLLLSRRVNWPHPSYLNQGNVLLDRLFGAQLHVCDLDQVDGTRDALLEQLKQEGRSAYEIPAGGSNPIGALGYVRCMAELARQADALGVQLGQIVHASASAGTQSGLVFGANALGLETHIMGVNVFHPSPETLRNRVQHIIRGLCERHPQAGVNAEVPIDINHAYLGEAYGIPSAEGLAAIHLAARMEGILLDPVYSGKAFAALIDQVNLGNFNEHSAIVFIHTGGHASLGAYADAFADPEPA
jgi:L-cysteate sulfo-lyase